MYAGCSVLSCDKKSKYLIDTKNFKGRIETHSRCTSHGDDLDTNQEVLKVVDIHDIVIPLSEGGSGTIFNSGCSFCGDKKADEIIRFKDGFDVVSTEARCRECVRDIAENRDLMTRKNIEEVSTRAEDCQ